TGCGASLPLSFKLRMTRGRGRSSEKSQSSSLCGAAVSLMILSVRSRVACLRRTGALANDTEPPSILPVGGDTWRRPGRKQLLLATSGCAWLKGDISIRPPKSGFAGKANIGKVPHSCLLRHED